MVTLAAIGPILVELCLLNFRKIPFACSYLPGQLRMDVVLLGALGLLVGSVRLVLVEHDALSEIGPASTWIASFVFLWLITRLIAWSLARGSAETEFEQEDATAVQTLGLGGD